ncbi:MAG: glycosyltransferase [Actinomycetota bacterium]|nr:glycosyltransferase [Actinomycetota bacterium]
MDATASAMPRPQPIPEESPGESPGEEYSASLARAGYVVVSSDTAGYHPEPANPLVSIVVPFYNPGPVFESAIREIVEVMEGTGVSYELIAVSDGSTDSSKDALVRLGISTIKDVYHLQRNGKGSALRTGLRLGKGEYLGFIDADGDIDPKALAGFISVLIAFQPDIVLGSKRHPASQVVYPPARRLYSFVYQQLIRRLFNLSIHDTQTGVKLCRREVIERALPLMVEKRFAFDLELFVVARRLGYDKFVEAPVIIRDRFSSTVNMIAVARTLLDTLAIFYRERVLHFYDRVA